MGECSPLYLFPSLPLCLDFSLRSLLLPYATLFKFALTHIQCSLSYIKYDDQKPPSSRHNS